MAYEEEEFDLCMPCNSGTRFKKRKTQRSKKGKNNNNYNKKTLQSNKEKSNDDKISCWYTNATSLNNKINEISAICSTSKIDLMFISETWFDSNSLPQIPGYTVYRQDRITGRVGGGVCIYVNENLEHRPASFARGNGTNLEQVWCEIVSKNEIILAGCCYRPPDLLSKQSEVDIEIIKSLTAAKRAIDQGLYGGMILAGDFNYRNIKWHDDGTGSKKGKLTPENLFIETLNDCHFHQSVCFPTFYTADARPTNTLDLLVSDSPERVCNLLQQAPLGNSKQGHVSLKWSYNTASVTHLRFQRSKYNFAMGDYEKFKSFTESLDWIKFFEGCTTNECYERFLEKYNDWSIQCIPTKALGTKRMKPWLTKEIRDLISLKKSLWKKQQSTFKSKPAVLRLYRETSRKLKKCIKKSVNLFEFKIASDKHNPKRLFAYINSKKNLKQSISSLKRPDGTSCTDSKEMVEILNSQFSGVFVDENCTDIPVLNNRLPESATPLEGIEFNIQDVMTKLKKLDKNKAPGNDGVHPHVISNLSESMAWPLYLIFKKSLDSGDLPDKWKESNVSPLFKKGCRMEPANYRPVSLTSIPCKILESLVRDRLMSHLEINKLLAKEQHGFVKQKACNTNLMETIDFISQKIANKSSIDIAFLDYAKAFDTVPHLRLRNKLKAYGVVGKASAWINSFLSNRRQRVVMGEIMSNWSQVKSGVPQGSVLGPSLFIIYINDLPENLSNVTKIYADDTKIIADTSRPDANLDLQKDLDALADWSDRWLIKLNVEKCKIMHLGKRNPLKKYFILDKGERIEVGTTKFEKDLGIVWSSDASWTEQCNRAASKANSVLGMLKKTFVTRNSATWRKLYTTFIRPHLEFCAMVWSPFNKADIATLERIQRRATKTPHHMKSLDYASRCDKWKLTSLTERRARGDLITMFKIQKGLEVVNWHNPQIIHRARAGRRPQLSRELIKNSQIRYNFFLNRVARSWNRLPDEVVDAKSVVEFKSKLDNFTMGCYSEPPSCGSLRHR